MVKEKPKKYTLPFINDGKPFEINKWTMKKQERVWKETSKYEEQYKNDEAGLNRVYRKILIKIGLEDIGSITDEQLENMHPDDLASLYMAIYLQGREGILVEDKKSFRTKDTKEKSTAK